MFYGAPEDRKEELLQAINTIANIYPAQTYANDMLICILKNCHFLRDQRFTSAFYSSATNEQEKSLLWRIHTLTWAATNALNIEGDFVECGVFKGFCSEVILKYLSFQNVPKRAFLYDTFEGLPEKTSTEEERRTWDYSNYDSEALYVSVLEKFSVYENVSVIRGIVPDSFSEEVPEKIAFLHIDMNSVQAEILALQHLFDRVTKGGIIIFDDFGWMCNAGQMLAELKFLNERSHSILELPTGQGMVIKHG